MYSSSRDKDHVVSLASQMKSSKILCVGAGGIGCELLKTLVLTGFEDIELVRDILNMCSQCCHLDWEKIAISILCADRHGHYRDQQLESSVLVQKKTCRGKQGKSCCRGCARPPTQRKDHSSPGAPENWQIFCRSVCRPGEQKEAKCAPGARVQLRNTLVG